MTQAATVKPELTLPMRAARFVLGLFGWRVVDNLPPTRKFITIAAWHTSNWDFPLSILAMWGLGLPLKFIGKQELIDSKLGWVFKRLGVIGVDRSKKDGKFVDRIADLFDSYDELMIAVPPEGTRGKAEYWRTGFYYMALAADVPIAFAQVDTVKKEVGINGYFKPSGNREEDLGRVKAFYENKRGLKPENQSEIKFRPLAEAS